MIVIKGEKRKGYDFSPDLIKKGVRFGEKQNRKTEYHISFHLSLMIFLSELFSFLFFSHTFSPPMESPIFSNNCINQPREKTLTSTREWIEMSSAPPHTPDIDPMCPEPMHVRLTHIKRHCEALSMEIVTRSATHFQIVISFIVTWSFWPAYANFNMHPLCSVPLAFCWPSLVVGILRPLFLAFYLMAIA